MEIFAFHRGHLGGHEDDGLKVPGPQKGQMAGYTHFQVMRDGRGRGGREGMPGPKAQVREPMKKANLFALSPNVIMQDVAFFSGLIFFPQ